MPNTSWSVQEQFRCPLKVSLVDTGIRVCPMSDVCHNLLGLHTNVKQDTVTARREGERESRKSRFEIFLDIWAEDTQVSKESFVTSIGLRKSFYQNNKNTSQNVLSISQSLLYELFSHTNILRTFYSYVARHGLSLGVIWPQSCSLYRHSWPPIGCLRLCYSEYYQSIDWG